MPHMSNLPWLTFFMSTTIFFMLTWITHYYTNPYFKKMSSKKEHSKTRNWKW